MLEVVGWWKSSQACQAESGPHWYLTKISADQIFNNVRIAAMWLVKDLARGAAVITLCLHPITARGTASSSCCLQWPCLSWARGCSQEPLGTRPTQAFGAMEESAANRCFLGWSGGVPSFVPFISARGRADFSGRERCHVGFITLLIVANLSSCLVLMGDDQHSDDEDGSNPGGEPQAGETLINFWYLSNYHGWPFAIWFMYQFIWLCSIGFYFHDATIHKSPAHLRINISTSTDHQSILFFRCIIITGIFE